MGLIADIALALLAGLGILLALLLVAPLSASARGAVDAERFTAGLTVRLRWLFGVVGLDLVVRGRTTLRLCGIPVARFDGGPDDSASDAGRARGRERREERQTRKTRKTQKKSRRPGRGIGWLMAYRDTLWRALTRLVATLHLRGRVTGTVGLPEPDDTVWLALALHQLERRLPAGTLGLELDYSDAVLELEGRLSAWFIPLHVAGTALALYLFTDLRRALRRPRPVDPMNLEARESR